jgi:nicotinamide phosphoribosyltransferase
MEHSTVTSWGRENEVNAYRNMVKKNGKPGGIVSAVSDSYDIFEACRLWGTELKQDIIDSGATLVVRPDSGHPAAVVLKCLQILQQHFGYTINEKGFKVLSNVRVLQGDGVNIQSIGDILDTIIAKGFSADNVVFGQGGALLQIVNRDDQKFAMKCSAARINGKWVDVFKDPITDSGKRSKKGKMILKHTPYWDSKYFTYTTDGHPSKYQIYFLEDELKTVFIDGNISRQQTLDEIRDRAKI